MQRAIPFHQLKSMKWGEPILLASWKAVKEEDDSYTLAKGVAEVFGYFLIEGVSHTLPDELAKELTRRLDVVREVAGGWSESRYCGSYTVGGVVYVRDSIEELVGKTEEVCRAHGVKPEDFKWFVRGGFIPFKTPMWLFPSKFTRSYMKIKLDGLNLHRAVAEGGVVWLYDYNQRRYVSSHEAAALGCRSLKSFTTVVA